MTSTETITVPKVGQLVQVRRRRYISDDVASGELAVDRWVVREEAGQYRPL